jgi:hypothetical protein
MRPFFWFSAISYRSNDPVRAESALAAGWGDLRPYSRLFAPHPIGFADRPPRDGGGMGAALHQTVLSFTHTPLSSLSKSNPSA